MKKNFLLFSLLLISVILISPIISNANFSYHPYDTNRDCRISQSELDVANADYQAKKISLSQLLRIIQFFNIGGYMPQSGTEDGFTPTPNPNCPSNPPTTPSITNVSIEGNPTTWTQGTTKNITWRTNGSIPRVDVMVCTTNSCFYAYQNIENNNSIENVRIGTNIPINSQAYIKVRKAGDDSIKGVSNTFIVVAPSNPPTTPSITNVSIEGNPTTWVRGTSKRVNWQTNGNIPNIDILVCNVGGDCVTVFSNITNNNYENIRIPNSISINSQAYIKVRKAGDDSIKGVSNTFTVLRPSGGGGGSSGNYLSCYDNDLYRFSSSGLRLGKHEECGNDYCENWSQPYCDGNKIYQKRLCYKKGCSSNACYSQSYTETKVVQTCASNEICSNSQCKINNNSQCSVGACCQNNLFKSSNSICSSQSETEYGCPWGTSLGSNVGKRTRIRLQYCSGNSSLCNGSFGPWLSWSEWTIADYCSSNQICVPGKNRCQGIETTQNQTTSQISSTPELTSSSSAIIVLADKEDNTINWAKNLEIKGNDLVNFLIIVKNTKNEKIENAILKIIIPEKLYAIEDLKIDGISSDGDIKSGINLGALEPNETKTISFRGKTRNIKEQKEIEIIGRIEFEKSSDYDSVKIAVKPTSQNLAFLGLATIIPFTSKWYFWVLLIAILAVYLLYPVFKKFAEKIIK